MPDQKALLLQEKQGKLVVGSRPIPQPGKGQLLVKVRAAGLNPVDWKIQEYGIFLQESNYPAVLGTDIAGDVVELGEGVDEGRWSKGTRVFFQGQYGTKESVGFQQYALIAAEVAVKIPAQMSYSEAASIQVAFVCAAYGTCVEKPIGAGLNPKFDSKVKLEGQHALVIGGSTSVGQYVIQILGKVLGFSTVVAYASAKHSDYLKSLGATHVVDRTQVPLSYIGSTTSDITSHSKFNFIYDAFDSEEARELGPSLLSEGGQMVHVNPFVEEKNEGRKRVFGVLGILHLATHKAAGIEMMKALEKWVEEGVIVPNRIYELPVGLEHIVEGLKILKEEKAGGAKVIGHPED